MKCSLLACCLVLSLSVFGQSNISTPDSAIANFQHQYPQEKVFLQTDKQVFFAGETIWMKAWCMLEEAPSFLSKIVYVDVTDQQGKVVLKKMLLLDSLASAQADFELPDSMASGTYGINAYTLWMKNFPNFIFQKPIVIYGADYKIRPGKGISEIKPVIEFFPEGGELVSGLNNRIAFKGLDENRLPFSFNGFIQDNTGKKIVDLKSEHDGMGVIEFVVDPNQVYRAKIEVAGKVLEFPVAPSKSQGVVLRVENANPNKLFVLLNRGELNKSAYQKIKLVAQINYSVVFKAVLDLEQGQGAVAINKKDLPPGILQVTAFDMADHPLAERLVFIENYRFSKPEIKMGAQSLEKQGINQVLIKLESPPASLSCVVTSQTAPFSSDISFQDHIASYFLMSSDLKGYIHEPGYYFKDKSPETLHHLDLLLMTQGWRRFEWESILDRRPISLVYPVETSINFKGNVYKTGTKVPVEKGYVSFVISASDSTKIIAQTDLISQGAFILKDAGFRDQANVSFMATDNQKAKTVVDAVLQLNYIDSLSHSKNIPLVHLDTLNLESETYPILEAAVSDLNSVQAKMLENITITGKIMRPEDQLNQKYASGMFRALHGTLIDPTTSRTHKSIWQLIQAQVPGVSLEYNADNPVDPILVFNRFDGIPNESTDGDEPGGLIQDPGGVTYYLNEMNVHKEVINNLNVDDVGLIKVLKNEGAALGARKGAIAIYTKTGSDMSAPLYEKGFTTQRFMGYAVAKKFYQPVEAPKVPGSSDSRTTLYWNGSFRPVNGQFNFQFKNNDFGKKYQILIQGIDQEGGLIFSSYKVP